MFPLEFNNVSKYEQIFTSLVNDREWRITTWRSSPNLFLKGKADNVDALGVS